MWYGASGRVHVDELGVEGKQLIFSRTLRQELRVFFFLPPGRTSKIPDIGVIIIKALIKCGVRSRWKGLND